MKTDAGVQIRGDLALGAGDFSVSPSRPGATSVLRVDSPAVQVYEVDLASWIHVRFLSFVNTDSKEMSHKRHFAFSPSLNHKLFLSRLATTPM